MNSAIHLLFSDQHLLTFKGKSIMSDYASTTVNAVTGSLKLGFLVPSLLAGIGSTLLVYDLLRRVRGLPRHRERRTL